MSALIDRLRRTVGAVSARPDDAVAVGYADVTAVLSALDAAEAECARLRGECDYLRGWRETADGLMVSVERIATERDTARAEVAALRAIVAAVRRERAVRAEWLATLPTCATAPADVLAAEAAIGAALAAADVDREAAGRALYEHVCAKTAGIPSIDPAREAWESWEALPEWKRESWRHEAATRAPGSWGLP